MFIHLIKPMLPPDKEDLSFVVGNPEYRLFVGAISFLNVFVVYVEYNGEFYKVVVNNDFTYPTMLAALGAASLAFLKLLREGFPDEEEEELGGFPDEEEEELEGFLDGEEEELEDNAFTRFIQSDLDFGGF